ncbi:uncharacterized protein K452DRAFT_362999 [Aplosporella prunicola CBS 121167]|uniref:Ankyrin repeat protein n=1 Tax=Aplosporella prunicola CBS 121167 TaxID=1176127 RepID=A0A6A6AXJ8_9PEZI|nr:uncharacterized protein K452DRAFT_362999 [Aplosporella prunicola CBS 121167]KAF2135715.1 hypothetical protein K452DRAFT_362999 [Aplosporella prunicola CBS 121167]
MTLSGIASGRFNKAPPPTRDDVFLAAIILQLVSFIETQAVSYDINATFSKIDCKQPWGRPLHSAVRTAVLAAVLTPRTDVNVLENGSLALETAACLDNKAAIHTLLAWPNVHCRADGDAVTKAVVAAFENDHTDAEMMILAHAAPAVLSIALPTCLVACCWHGSLDAARALLDKAVTALGTDAAVVADAVNDAMFSAICAGHEKMLRFLVQRGGQLGSLFMLSEQVHVLICNGNVGMLRMLVDAGFRAGYDGYDGLETAAKLDASDTVRALVQMGAVALDENTEEAQRYKITQRGDMARWCKAVLMGWACAYGNVELVRFYAANGFSVTPDYAAVYERFLGVEPVVVTRAYGQKEVERTLLELGARKVDPLGTAWRERFAGGVVPFRSLKERLLSESKDIEGMDRFARSKWCRKWCRGLKL